MTYNQNQQAAINDFLEGYGPETLKEYGTVFLEVITAIQHPNRINTATFVLDISEKFASLYKLISALEPIHILEPKPLAGVRDN